MLPDFEAGEGEPRDLLLSALDDEGAVRPRRVPMLEGEEEALLSAECVSVEHSVTGPLAVTVLTGIILE